MAKIELELRDVELDGLSFPEIREALDRAEKDFTGYDVLRLRIKAEPYDLDEAYTNIHIAGLRDESPAEAAKREADAVAADRRALAAAKAKVAEIEARLAGK